MADASPSHVVRGRVPLTQRQRMRRTYEELVVTPESKRSVIENDFVALYDLFDKAGGAPEDLTCF